MAQRFTTWIGSPASLIIHTVLFTAAFLVGLVGVLPWDTVLLVLTTAVSLEAIYLAIFIQMTMNAQAASLKEVEEDIDEIQKDVDEIQEDIDSIEEDVDEIQEDDVDDERRDLQQQRMLADVSNNLQRLLADIEKMKKELNGSLAGKNKNG